MPLTELTREEMEQMQKDLERAAQRLREARHQLVEAELDGVRSGTVGNLRHFIAKLNNASQKVIAKVQMETGSI